VVFALLAMLLTIAMPRFMVSTDSAKAKVREQNMETLRDAIDKFKGDQGRYPADLQELVQRQYLRRVPVDPVTGWSSWKVLAPAAAGETGVFDIAAPEQPTSAPAVVPEAAK
jgi:general secretion pathway protein G